MCLLSIGHRVLNEAPLFVAANREEYFDHPASLPAIQPGSPRVLCGIDGRAGGTWLGVNEHGLVVAVTNRDKQNVPPAPRSRGRLCRELLDCKDAGQAVDRAQRELAENRYAGANWLCADAERAVVIYAGNQPNSAELPPGMHFIANADVNDFRNARLALARRMFAAAEVELLPQIINVARRVLSYKSNNDHDPDIVLRFADRGTVSSTIISLHAAPKRSFYHHAAGPPDRVPYEDYSELLLELLRR